MKFPVLISLLLNSVIFFPLKAQEEKALTLAQADSLFLTNNLLLLAAQYDVNASEALIIQAKAYPNPLVTADLNLIDPENNKTFHVGETGQKFFSIEQLIRLGGKRKNEIAIAKQNKEIATLELEDLLRTLQWQLHTGFYTIHQQAITLLKFNRQLQLLDTLISAYDVQVKKGNLPAKDVIRLKAVYFKINNDKSEVANALFSEQQKIQMLLQQNVLLTPVVSDEDYERLTRPLVFDDLLSQAQLNRPDLKLMNENKSLALLELKLQRSLAVPDVAINGSYDQRSGAFVNQVNVGLSIPLPLWNRNKGNIKAAEINTHTAEIYQNLKAKEVETQVMEAWQNLSLSVAEYNKVKSFYTEDFDLVFEGVNQNFQKNNISILEFVDFFESYNESLSEYERVKNYLATSAMQINYVTASNNYQ